MPAPTYFRDADVAALLADIGRPVVIAGQTIQGLVDYVGRDALATMNVAGVSGRVITVAVQTSALPSGAKNRAAVTVDGQSFHIRDMQSMGDGAVTHLLCEA
jgi:hypothetical protein